jgi:hypothetical protein
MTHTHTSLVRAASPTVVAAARWACGISPSQAL